MTVNVPLLRAVLTFATNNPNKYDQEQFARKTDCGTAYCIAGIVAARARQRFWWDYDSVDGYWADELRDGGDVDRFAADQLGLPKTLREAQLHEQKVRHLFASENSLATCWQIASELTDGEIEVPEQFRVEVES